MNHYGKTLAHTGAVAVLGMTAGWTIAVAAAMVAVGALSIRLSFRRRRTIGQR
jgi:hypothetical protein